MTFNYNSKYFGSAPQQRLANLSGLLLDCLDIQRKNAGLIKIAANLLAHELIHSVFTDQRKANNLYRSQLRRHSNPASE